MCARRDHLFPETRVLVMGLPFRFSPAVALDQLHEQSNQCCAVHGRVAASAELDVKVHVAGLALWDDLVQVTLGLGQ